MLTLTAADIIQSSYLPISDSYLWISYYILITWCFAFLTTLESILVLVLYSMPSMYILIFITSPTQHAMHVYLILHSSALLFTSHFPRVLHLHLHLSCACSPCLYSRVPVGPVPVPYTA